MADGFQNDAASTQPVLETTAKRRKLLSPIDDETLSRRPSSILPDDLIVEILLRLPASSLLQFRRVCKSWGTLISDPQFAKKHLRCSTANPSMTHQRLVSPVITEHYNVINIIVSCPVKPLFENPSTTAKAVRFRMRNEYSIFGSCNGLICLYDRFQGHVRLWNPSTRLISKRSPTVFADGGVITYNGFGYDQVNDKYKVMTVTDDFNEPVTKVYTFGANSWTTIQNLPCCTLATTRWFGIFVSGTLNWVTKGGGSSDQWVISSFDLVKESYGKVLLPQQDGDNICNPVLDVLSNCICLCFYSNKAPHWDVWLMKEYGVAESWTKLMMIPHENFWSSGWLASFEPLCISENGVVLMKSFYHSKLVLYDSKNVKLDYPKISSKLGVDQHIYHESLVSPPMW